MPTRGGTPFSHPRLLNCLLSEIPTRADTMTEVYAVGCSGVYALTGESPFGYSLVNDSKGKPISVGDKILNVTLKDDGKTVDCVDARTHERKLKTKLRKVPRRYRNLFHRALTLDDRKAYKSISEFKRDFERTKNGFWGNLGEQIVRGVKPTLITAAGVGILGLVIMTGNNREPKPTLMDILAEEDYRDFSLETLQGVEREYVLDLLYPTFKEINETLPDMLEQRNDGTRNGDFIENMLFFSNSVHRMDSRLISAWLTANLLSNEKKVIQSYGEKRIFPSYVPEMFILKNRNFHSPSRFLDHNGIVAQEVIYLKQCLGKGKDVADVLSQYYCSIEDINTAMVRTGSIKYFPRVSKDFTLEIGYAQFLPEVQRKLIDTGVALYMITDKDGIAHLDRIPELGFTPGTYRQNLHLMY